MSGPPRYWTRDRIIAAIRAWAAARGEPPRLAEWYRSAPGYPAHTTVVDLFGSWNGAIRAAGFTGRCQGWPREDSTAGAPLAEREPSKKTTAAPGIARTALRREPQKEASLND